MLKKISNRSSVKRGSALVMAILITMLLFIIGMGFISNMLTDKASVARIDDDAILDNAVDTVIEQINTVLTEDLYIIAGSPPRPQFLFGPAAYDYPDGNNRWLASLEPELGDINNDGLFEYFWPHITDLWGNFGGTKLKLTYYYDPPPPLRDPLDALYNPLAWDYSNPFSDMYMIEFNRGTVCRIIPENYPITDAILNDMAGNNPWVAGYNQAALDGILTVMRGHPAPSIWDPILDGYVPPTNHILSLVQADADGDGVSDSRWVRLYRIDQDGPWDHAIYAAVRIIDNGGMVNINTALRDPTIDGLNWDGSSLTHINLDRHANFYEINGIIAQTEPKTIADLHAARCGLLVMNDIGYHQNVAMRLLNPFPGANPFDITDELELRNRVFLTSPVNTRSEQTWQTTFDPGPGTVGRMLPYFNQVNLADWYDKMTPDMNYPFFNYLNGDPIIGNYNRRHLATTYSFDRASHPYSIYPPPPPPALPQPFIPSVPGSMVELWSAKVGLYQPAWMLLPGDYIARLAGAIYLGLPDDVQTRFGPNYTRETLAWHYAVNLVDLHDVPLIPDPTFHQAATTEGIVNMFGVENSTFANDTVLISKIGFVDDIFGNIDFGNPRYYFIIELFNPGITRKDLSQYKLWIGHTADPVKRVEIPLNGFLEPQDPTNDDDVMVFVYSTEYNGTGQDVSAGSINIIKASFPKMANDPVNLPELVFLRDNSSDPNQLVLVKPVDYSGVWQDMPVDCIEVPAEIYGGIDSFNVQERYFAINDGVSINHLLLSHPGLWRFSADAGGQGNLGLSPDDPGYDYPIEQVNIQMDPSPLTNIGEIDKVFAVGNSYNIVTGDCHTFTEGVGHAFYADPCDYEENVAGYEYVERSRRSWGRVNLADSDYWGLLDHLTYFDPAGDSIDNDGSLLTNENPLNDGIDNNGDGLVDGLFDPFEAFYTEQALPGRININTAPWFVIRQLPWMTDELAHAIVAFRDKTNLGLKIPGAPNYSLGRDLATTGTTVPNTILRETRGFRHIGELMRVVVPDPNAFGFDQRFDIRQHMFNKDGGGNLDSRNEGPPDFSVVNDIIADDFEERDLIFNRISNLVTVRSDVFTAYILVRIGRNGPQKRMIAIFDRSNVFTLMDQPKLVALHPVPDPR